MSDKQPPTPRAFTGNYETSPSKGNAFVDPAKLIDKPLPFNADLDRQLAVWANMDKTLLATLEEFEQNILWPEEYGEMPKPPKEALDTATEAINALFHTESGLRLKKVSEDIIARTIVDDVINKIKLPSGLRAGLSQYKYHPTDPTKSKVDAALYPSDALPKDERPDWTHLRLFIEFKAGDVEHDPFDDKSDHPESWAQTRAKVRGQLLAYASNTFQYQHRIALISLFINGDEFRAMHWDRSGLIVTMATNYVDDPAALVRFLFAFATLTPERQGSDPTATLIPKGSPEYKLMDVWARENPALDMPFKDNDDVSQFFNRDATAPAGTAAPSGPAGGTRKKAREAAEQANQPPQPSEPIFKYVRDRFRESLEEGWPRYKLLVGGGPSPREFLVAKPTFAATSMFGRGTRGYIAYDVKGQRLVFLKDSWRPFYEGVEPEGNYLQTMASKPNAKLMVPTVVEHGDVRGQTTFAAEYGVGPPPPPEVPVVENPSSSARSKKRPREESEPEEPSKEPEESRLYIHYRIAVEEVCLPMGDFKSGGQLVRLILECVVTHQNAYTEFDLLHRDISTGNLLILPKIRKRADGKMVVVWHGFLTDWELAKYVPKDVSKQRARQPERTGTWQFMSVAYVRHPERPVAIPDELESFFHVLLHHAVRYLRHNLPKAVTTFIIEYFDTFSLVDVDRFECSTIKDHAMSLGVVKVGSKTLAFKFDDDGSAVHPLNVLLRKWVDYFVCRYTILNRQDDDKPVLVAQGPRAKPRSAATTVKEDHPDLFADSDSEDSDALDDEKSASTATRSDAQVEAKSKALDTHRATIKLLKSFTRPDSEWDWPNDDRVGDQLGKEYNPKRLIVDKMVLNSVRESGRVSQSSKKARLDMSGASASRSGLGSVAHGGSATGRSVKPAMGELFTGRYLPPGGR